MKTALIYTIIGLLAINSLTAQVKIGDNPQNLNPASLLELESTSRALVISRVTDAQMSAISPLRGALVYNTDQNCLHYYDGTEWINICEALDDSFTTSTEDGTIIITQDGDNYDFSVGLIDSSNIPRNSIEGSDIAPGVIDSQHYANNSINPEEHFNGLASNTRQIIIWNGTDWVYTLESDLQISEADGVIGNEVVDVTDGTLTRSGNGDAGDPYTLGVSPLGITENELANNAVTSTKILNGTILEEDIANDAVTLDKIANGTTSGQLMRWNGTDWVLVDETLLNITETDGIVGNEVTDATLNGSLALNGTGTQADPLTLDVLDGGIDTDELADGAVTTNKILDANVTRAKFEDGTTTGQLMQWDGTDWVLIDESALNITETDGIVGNEVTDATLNGSLALNGTGTQADPLTLDVLDGGIDTDELADGAVTTNKILDANVTRAKLEDGTTNGQLMQWDGTDWVLVDETSLDITEDDGIIGNEVTDATLNGSLALNGTGTQADPLTLDVLDGGIDTDELADGAVTTNKILDANVTRAKLEDGTTNGQLMQWDGTNWILIDTPTVSEGDGITVTPSGQDFNVAVTNPVVALGRVNNNATIVNASGVALPAAGSGVTRTSTGNYSVQFATPRPAGDVNYIVQLTVLNQPQPGTTIEVSNPTINGFDVTIYAPFPMPDFYETQDPTTPTTVDPHTHSVVVDNILYSPVDSSWYFTVTNL
ncbi:hypothetical protein GUA46_12665 [Muricauda sp. HICW]|uniref:Uncharacterized protein n=1 Tax=Flagellimonas chongwuensis TaxID=2697365 RepID=A0A850NGF6_9FLAO|nr:hypothetical protein [Allomuricauda chongwuensis]NVN19194.1 hypothetical protein [Allomuricauda chongwuensis]